METPPTSRMAETVDQQSPAFFTYSVAVLCLGGLVEVGALSWGSSEPAHQLSNSCCVLNIFIGSCR
jgi:hypothetical protein